MIVCFLDHVLAICSHNYKKFLHFSKIKSKTHIINQNNKLHNFINEDNNARHTRCILL